MSDIWWRELYVINVLPALLVAMFVIASYLLAYTIHFPSHIRV